MCPQPVWKMTTLMRPLVIPQVPYLVMTLFFFSNSYTYFLPVLACPDTDTLRFVYGNRLAYTERNCTGSTAVSLTLKRVNPNGNPIPWILGRGGGVVALEWKYWGSQKCYKMVGYLAVWVPCMNDMHFFKRDQRIHSLGPARKCSSGVTLQCLQREYNLNLDSNTVSNHDF